MDWRRGWGFWEPASPLSILELVKAGNLDLRLASLLWLMMAQRASAIVAAGPSRAGKTTTLNCLLDFLPPEVKQVELQGYGEDFSFVKKGKPAETYVVAAEFSQHGFANYVWGDTALRAFQLLHKGYGVGATMHAEKAEEVLGLLYHYLGVPLQTLTQLHVIVTLFVARRGHDEIIRRINDVNLVIPHNGGIALERLAWWNPKGDSFEIASDKVLATALSLKLHVQKESVVQEMEKRERFLDKLLKDEKISRDEVRQGIIEFYGSQPAP